MTTRTAPTISADRARWGEIFTDPAVWHEAVAAILDRHGLGPLDTLRAGVPGSHAVFVANEALVVKLYAPFWGETAPLERGLLATLAPHRLVALPTARATGSLPAGGHDWPYLVMDFVAGERWGDIWPTLPAAERHRLAADLGRLLRRLHGVAPGALTGVPFPGRRGDWHAFLAAQIVGAEDRHRRAGLSPELLARLPAFLAAARPALDGVAAVLLHGDVTADHLLLRQEGAGQWQIRGLIDFGDARLGTPCYDFVAVAADALRGEVAALRACLAAYGLPGALDDPTFRRALTALALLHEYADVGWLVGPPGGAGAMSDLANLEAALCGAPPSLE